MSIIHDALKKTQKNLNNITQHNISKNTEENSSKNNSMKILDETKIIAVKTPKNHSAIIIFCLIIITIVLVASTVISFLKTKSPSTSRKTASKITQEPTSQSIKTTAKPSTKTSINTKPHQPGQSLVLNGTLMANDKKAALINNELYEIGESIEGKTISNIFLNKVELLDKNGTTTILKVKK